MIHRAPMLAAAALLAASVATFSNTTSATPRSRAAESAVLRNTEPIRWGTSGGRGWHGWTSTGWGWVGPGGGRGWMGNGWGWRGAGGYAAPLYVSCPHRGSTNLGWARARVC